MFLLFLNTTTFTITTNADVCVPSTGDSIVPRVRDSIVSIGGVGVHDAQSVQQAMQRLFHPPVRRCNGAIAGHCGWGQLIVVDALLTNVLTSFWDLFDHLFLLTPWCSWWRTVL